MPARPEIEATRETAIDFDNSDPIDSVHRQQPELAQAKPVEKKEPLDNEFNPDVDDMDEDPVRLNRMNALLQGVARQASLDRSDDLGM